MPSAVIELLTTLWNERSWISQAKRGSIFCQIVAWMAELSDLAAQRSGFTVC